MLHNKFRRNGPPVPEKIFMVFYHIWACRPSWSCDLIHLYKLSFPLPKDAPHEVWLRLEENIFEIVDDRRTPEHGHPISSPFEPSAQVC